MKSFSFFLLIFLLAGSTAFSQIVADSTSKATSTGAVPEQSSELKKETPKKERAKKPERNNGQKVYFGGSMGLTFGSYTRIALYPLIGYKFTPKLSGGVKFYYEWVKDKRYSVTYESSNYGGGVFGRYRIVPQFYIHAEYSFINYDLSYMGPDVGRDWVEFLYLGGGYSQNLGGNVWLNAQVLFDVLQQENSPYGNWEPLFSVGISAGF